MLQRDGFKAQGIQSFKRGCIFLITTVDCRVWAVPANIASREQVLVERLQAGSTAQIGERRHRKFACRELRKSLCRQGGDLVLYFQGPNLITNFSICLSSCDPGGSTALEIFAMRASVKLEN